MFCHSAHAGREVAIERTCWSRRYIGSKSSNFTQESEACFALVEIGIFHFSQRNVKVFLTDSSSHLLSHVPLSRNFSAPINLWRVGHPRRKPKYLLYYWRFAGALERGNGGRFLISELPRVLVAPGGRPPTERNYDVVQSRLLNRTCPGTKIYADGNKAWPAQCKILPRKCFQVKHCKMQFLKRSKLPFIRDHGPWHSSLRQTLG